MLSLDVSYVKFDLMLALKSVFATRLGFRYLWSFFSFLLIALSKFDADVCSQNCVICINGYVRSAFNVNYCVFPAFWA